jgi:hypothetical protein
MFLSPKGRVAAERGRVGFPSMREIVAATPGLL